MKYCSPAVRLLLVIVALSFFAPAAEAQVEWLRLDPAAVRSERTEPVTLDLQVSLASVASIRLQFVSGSPVMLTPAGGGRFTATLPAEKVLHGYGADDVNHNHVGWLHLLDGAGTTLATFNLFANVIDERVPAVNVRDLGNGARATARVLNIHRPSITPQNLRAAAKAFYEYFPDEFDFLQIVFSGPVYPGNRYHFATRNDVAGIGQPMFNVSPEYGSSGKLLGITVFPIDSLYDTGEATFSHELGHQWIQFLDNPVLDAGKPHWPPSTMGRGIMGANITGGIGGTFPWEISAVTESTARVRQAEVIGTYTDFDLYLMGLLPASEVSPGVVLKGTPCNDCVVPSVTVTIDDVIAANGPRVPDASIAQKSFRIGSVVVSRDRLLDDDEMAFLEHFTARGEARTPLPFTAGFGRGMTNPFSVATRGLGTVDFRLVHQPPVRRRPAGK